MRMNEFMLTHFIQKAENETLEHCYTPMVQQCGGGEYVTGEDGEELCQEYYETSCVTRYGDNTNKAVTECRKVTEPLLFYVGFVEIENSLVADSGDSVWRQIVCPCPGGEAMS